MEMNGRGPPPYRSHIFRRYLWMAFLPASFFVLLGVAAIGLSQGFVGRELRDLSDKSFRSAREAAELLFAETDSLALGLSIDPEFGRALKNGLRARLATLSDLKTFRTIQSSLASSVNSRPYLKSILVSMDNPSGLELSSSEGFIRPENSEDPLWLDGASGHEAAVSSWTEVREIAPFGVQGMKFKVLSFYRNLLGISGLLEREGVLCVNVDLAYLRRFLQARSSIAGGKFLIADYASGRMIAGDESLEGEAGRLLASFPPDGSPPGGRAGSPGTRSFRAGGVSYAVSASASDRLPFAYYLLTPRADFDRIPRTIGAIAAAFALLSLVAGAGLVLATARSNYRLIDGIVEITEAAARGEPLPRPSGFKDEALNFVTFSVLRTFIEHDYYKVLLSERELRQRTLELMALQAQMNPHFLFNTLTTIGCKAMALAKGPSELSRMVELLSGMLGYALSDPGAPVTLREELAHARAYFEIQQLRFGDRLSCGWSVDEEALAVGCVKLLVQPLVENCVEHGLGQLEDGGRVEVGASVEGGIVTVSVSDDGAGMDAARIAEIEAMIEEDGASFDKVGLVNTVKRLRLTYASGCSYAIDSSPGRGASVTLRFPALPAPPARPAPSAAGSPEGSSRSSS
jgi:two-component system, sensor histidine kinase YesM